MLAYSIRTAGYTLFDESTKWGVLLFEPLHGITYGAVQTASVAYVSSIAPRGGEASAQSLLSYTRSVGGVVGTVVGSMVMQEYGSHTAFRVASLCVFLSILPILLFRKK